MLTHDPSSPHNPPLGEHDVVDLTFSEPHLRNSQVPKALEGFRTQVDNLAATGNLNGTAHSILLGYKINDTEHQFTAPADREAVILAIMEDSQQINPSKVVADTVSELAIASDRTYRGHALTFITTKAKDGDGRITRNILDFSMSAYVPEDVPVHGSFKSPTPNALSARAGAALGIAAIVSPIVRAISRKNR